MNFDAPVPRHADYIRVSTVVSDHLGSYVGWSSRLIIQARPLPGDGKALSFLHVLQEAADYVVEADYLRVVNNLLQ